MRIDFLDSAAAEFTETIAYYNLQSEGLGYAFATEVKRAMERILQYYRELIVWQKAMDLVELVYQVTQTFPKEELYGLTNQVRRAAVSIPLEYTRVKNPLAHHLEPLYNCYSLDKPLFIEKTIGNEHDVDSRQSYPEDTP